MGTIDQGSTINITATGEQGVVIAPSTGGPFKNHHAGPSRSNIPVFTVLLESGEVRQYIGSAIELVS